MAIFDIDGFVAECLEALTDAEPVGAVEEAMERAMARPHALADRFPVPVDADDDGILYRSSELFIACAMFPKGFATGIHSHATPAIIGVWAGHEDNQLYRRAGEGIVSCGTRRVDTGGVLSLGPDAIHDVHTPATRWSGALHVYLADLTALDRDEWTDPEGPASRFDGAELERRWLETAQSTGLVSHR
jgi:predicted metal-dependent enzyme (double-stranded beta helix superfamily)